MNRTLAPVAALALLLAAGSANAADPLARATTALGQYIAAQGNAALVQIREELTRDLRAFGRQDPSTEAPDAERPDPTPEAKSRD